MVVDVPLIICIVWFGDHQSPHLLPKFPLSHLDIWQKIWLWAFLPSVLHRVLELVKIQAFSPSRLLVCTALCECECMCVSFFFFRACQAPVFFFFFPRVCQTPDSSNSLFRVIILTTPWLRADIPYAASSAPLTSTSMLVLATCVLPFQATSRDRCSQLLLEISYWSYLHPWWRE